MSVNVTSNSPSQDFTHVYDHNLRIHDNIILISLNLSGPKRSIVHTQLFVTEIKVSLEFLHCLSNKNDVLKLN